MLPVIKWTGRQKLPHRDFSEKPAMTLFQETREGLILSVRAQPNAKTNGIAGVHNQSLKIRLQAPPVEGKANKALIRFLSKTLGIPKTTIEIITGETGREKRILIHCQDPQAMKRMKETIQKQIS